MALIDNPLAGTAMRDAQRAQRRTRFGAMMDVPGRWTQSNRSGAG